MSKFFINRPIVAILIAILMVILADVFRDSAVPSVILTPNGLVLSWNAAAERLFGWSADEVLGRPLTSVLVPAHRAETNIARYGYVPWRAGDSRSTVSPGGSKTAG